MKERGEKGRGNVFFGVKAGSWHIMELWVD
jgi:hypothetical protein